QGAKPLSEPQAAAIQYAAGERLQRDEIVAVYDLGGGTFDAAVLRKTDTGFTLMGEPEGIEHLGGIDFDEAVFGHVASAAGDALGQLDPNDEAAAAAFARLRRDCVEAKEALSFDTEVMIPVALPNLHTQVRLNRSEFEAMIAPALSDTIGAMRRALHSAGVAPAQLRAVLLSGGSSRIPLVAQLVAAGFGRPVMIDPQPEHSIALGAAVATTAQDVFAPATAQAWPAAAAAPAPAATAPPVDPGVRPAGPEAAAEPAVHLVEEPTVNLSARRVRWPSVRLKGRPRSLVADAGRRRWLLAAAAIAAAVVATPVAITAAGLWPGSGGNTGSRTVADTPNPSAARPPFGPQPTSLWSFDTGRPITSRAILLSNAVYFGGEDGFVYALDRRDGHVIWKYATSARVVASPEEEGGVVYVASQDGYVYALGAARGDLRWKVRAGTTTTSSPRVDNRMVFIGSNNTLYAFDLTGKERWKYATGGGIPARPAYGFGLVFASSLDGQTYAIDAATGHKRWAVRTGVTGSVPTVLDDTLFVASDDRRLYCLDYRTGGTRWSFPTSGRVEGGVRAENGAAYFADSAGRVYALNSRTGTRRWLHIVDQGAPIRSIPVVVDGVVYVGSQTKRLYALNQTTGVKLWDSPTHGAIGPSLRVQDGVVYAGSDDGRMYALRLPVSTTASPTISPPASSASLGPAE
ncbi:MAG TPA: hsp70 family protein, partial [Pilimelia sp.]|nr:hsp70 family protein [Pilimelia sp.]